jgi:hypothetical protein
MMRAHLFRFATVQLLLLGPASLTSQDVPPDRYAFSGGVLTQAGLEMEVAAGRAWVEDDNPNGQTVVRHTVLETFERDKASTMELETVFLSCRSTFLLAIPGPKTLSNVVCDGTFLLWDGRARAPFFRITWDRSPPATQWQFTSQQRTPAQFLNALTPQIRERLWTTSGFLQLNPGTPPVPFESDALAARLGRLGKLPAVPGWFVTLLEIINAWEADQTLRSGWGADLMDPRVEQFRTRYQAKGRQMWGS